VPVLPDQDDRGRVEEGQHADALPAPHHTVDRRPAVGELDLVLLDADPLVLVDDARAARAPRHLDQSPARILGPGPVAAHGIDGASRASTPVSAAAGRHAASASPTTRGPSSRATTQAGIVPSGSANAR